MYIPEYIGNYSYTGGASEGLPYSKRRSMSPRRRLSGGAQPSVTCPGLKKPLCKDTESCYWKAGKGRGHSGKCRIIPLSGKPRKCGPHETKSGLTRCHLDSKLSRNDPLCYWRGKRCGLTANKKSSSKKSSSKKSTGKKSTGKKSLRKRLPPRGAHIRKKALEDGGYERLMHLFEEPL